MHDLHSVALILAMKPWAMVIQWKETCEYKTAREGLPC
jgi:hypothetical protein